MPEVEFEGKTFNVDEDGFIDDFGNWCPEWVQYVKGVEGIEELSDEPFPSNSVRVVNRKEKVFRIKIGDYRIIYAVFKKEDLLFISEINKRSKIY